MLNVITPTRGDLLRRDFTVRHPNRILAEYKLLHEAGTGEEYKRAKKAGDGHWLRLPCTYWLDEYDASLSHPQKLMLLIALDLQYDFSLPLYQSADRNGVPESTARRGFRGLEAPSC